MPVLEAAAAGSVRKTGAWTLLAVLPAAAALAWILHARAVVPAGPMNWDEGYHALYGLRTASDLKEARFGRLAYDAYRSVYWPPLHAFYLAGFFLGLGPSAEVARSSSLVALMAAAGVLAATGARARGGVAGLVAGLAFLVSPVVASLSAQAFLELPALALLLLGVGLHVTGRFPALLGLAVFATFLTRTNYGVLLAMGLTVSFAVEGAWGRRLLPGDLRLPARKAAGRTFLVLGLLLAAWFAYPPKIAHTLAALVNMPLGPDRFSAEGLLFYPRAAVRLAGSWTMAGAWAAALALSLRPEALRDRTVRLLVVLAAFQTLFAELSATKLERHILPLAGVLSLLLGLQAADVWARAGTAVRAALASVCGLLLAFQAAAVAGSASPAAARGPEVLLDRLRIDMGHAGTAVLVAPSDAFVAPATIDFTLCAAGILPLDGAGSLRSASEMRASRSLLRAAGPWLTSRARRWPGGGSYTVYIGLPSGDDAAQWTPANFARNFSAVLERSPAERVLALTGGEGVYPEVTPAFMTSALGGLGFSLESRVEVGAGTTLLAFCRELTDRRRSLPASSSAPPGP